MISVYNNRKYGTIEYLIKKEEIIERKNRECSEEILKNKILMERNNITRPPSIGTNSFLKKQSKFLGITIKGGHY